MQDNFHRPADHEAKMARADLFKCAQYSFKLFKMIGEDQELEGWVQAKITKAADYIASVYHYMEYEMKISEYGSAIENSDMYSESIRRAFAQKLTEAKVEAKKAKAKMASKEKDLEEAFDDKAKVGDKKKTATGELTKTDTGVIHKNTSYADDGDADDKSGKGKKSHAKSQSASEKKSQAPKLKQSPKSAKTWGMKDSEKFDNRDKVKEGVFGNDEGSLSKKSPQLQQLIALRKDPKYQSPEGKKALEARIKKQMDRVSLDKGEVVGADGKPVAVKEGKKPDFLDMDKDGNKKEPMKKAVADKKKNPFAKVKEATAKCNHTAKGKSCPVHGLKECGGMMEGYYDLNDDGMQPIDLSSRPSFKEILARYTQLVYQSHEGETSNEEDQEYNDIEAYVAKRFGEKGSAHLQKAGETSFYGRDDGRGQGGSRSSNLGRPNQPSGDFRTTKAGKMHGQDAKMMKSKVASRLGRHPEPNLPEQDMYEGNKFDPLKHVKNPTKGEKDAAKDVKRGSYGDRAAMLKSAEKDGRLKG
jgi:hypothetical protein